MHDDVDAAFQVSVSMANKKEARNVRPKACPKLYRFESPRNGADWPKRRSGTVLASSKAEVRRELVERGLLEHSEARATEFIQARA